MRPRIKIAIITMVLFILASFAACTGAVEKADEALPTKITQVAMDSDEYMDFTIDKLGIVSDNFAALSSILKDRTYGVEIEKEIEVRITLIESAANQYLALEEVPEEYTDAHKYMRRAMEDYKLSADAYPMNKEEATMENMAESLKYMISGSENLDKCLVEMTIVDELKGK